MSQFEQLQRGVAENPDYQERLGAAQDDESFVRTAATIAEELGLELSTQEIIEGVMAGDEAQRGELTESQLEGVAGGLSVYWTTLCRSLQLSSTIDCLETQTQNCSTFGCGALTDT